MKIITRGDARAKGLTRYFTGKPCRRGHFVERYTTGHCVKCAWEYDQAPEVKAYQKAYMKTPRATAWMRSYQKTYQKAYMKTPRRKAYQKAYEQSPEGRLIVKLAAVRHRVSKLRATPPWARHCPIIKSIYAKAQRLIEMTGDDSTSITLSPCNLSACRFTER